MDHSSLTVLTPPATELEPSALISTVLSPERVFFNAFFTRGPAGLRFLELFLR